MLWNFLTFCIAQKVTKSLVTRKTHFLMRTLVWLSGLPKAYLYFAYPASSSYGRNKQAAVTFKQFRLTVLTTENDFSNKDLMPFYFFFGSSEEYVSIFI